ncbi:MAG TPA: saccharopine dehydrogenase NADP-binding domain-containing protein [Oligoflexia bacterium]|nr:saccharopine dehydrogenase NADP-binding domain-containing protein [Oligoflexia bacterium]HMP26766.1 saccharopine dehydrogenase NADP-binding domain-containing protein [Oligoflexia bacterium]
MTRKKEIIIAGSGKIGKAICALLSLSEDYAITVADKNSEEVKKISSLFPNCHGEKLDLADKREFGRLAKNKEAVISALPYFCNEQLAFLAAENNLHYFDLTEDVATTERIKKIASSSKTAFVPQCGLAPGYISIAAFDLIKNFSSVETLKLRVGALPCYPTNRLKYNITWSADGLVNEYCNQCLAIVDNKLSLLEPLEGYERITLNGVEYEAFNTSGGAGSLCESLLGKVRNLNYKTLRYPGHRDLVAFLLDDLKFKNNKSALVEIFNKNIPTTEDDRCVIYLEATGIVDGKLQTIGRINEIIVTQIAGIKLTAIQLATAAGVCGVLNIFLKNKSKFLGGVIQNESFALDQFLADEFGKFYMNKN